EKNIAEQISVKGKQVIDATLAIIEKHGLGEYIEALRSYWTPVWLFHSKTEKNNLAYKTYFMQEMINAGVLFQGAFVGSLSHGEDEINYFLKGFETAVIAYKSLLESGDINNKLIGEPIKPVFRKYL
ncbi:MAG: hypothetical protein H7329_01685, partial [Opitutaceae bacterium]|nr:hypothetical protein [Cytophagales bacterium]